MKRLLTLIIIIGIIIPYAIGIIKAVVYLSLDEYASKNKFLKDISNPYGIVYRAIKSLLVKFKNLNN